MVATQGMLPILTSTRNRGNLSGGSRLGAFFVHIYHCTMQRAFKPERAAICYAWWDYKEGFAFCRIHLKSSIASSEPAHSSKMYSKRGKSQNLFSIKMSPPVKFACALLKTLFIPRRSSCSFKSIDSSSLNLGNSAHIDFFFPSKSKSFSNELK